VQVSEPPVAGAGSLALALQGLQAGSPVRTLQGRVAQAGAPVRALQPLAAEVGSPVRVLLLRVARARSPALASQLAAGLAWLSRGTRAGPAPFSQASS
jgi:hypothetical protein